MSDSPLPRGLKFECADVDDWRGPCASIGGPGIIDEARMASEIRAGGRLEGVVIPRVDAGGARRQAVIAQLGRRERRGGVEVSEAGEA